MLLSTIFYPRLKKIVLKFSPKSKEEAFSLFILLGIIIYSSCIAAYPNLTLPWYFNTEEFPYIQEVLRFIKLDFRQQFFDIPGTPLMFLGTLIWSAYYRVYLILGLTNQSHGIRYFSFEHLQSLYLLMRFISYFFYVLSIVLAYAIARRLTNPMGGLVTALLLGVSPTYGSTITHLRIEPTNLSLVLLSVWLILKALDTQSYRIYLISGIIAGLAMAARFQSMLAILPILLAYCIVQPIVFLRKGYRLLNIVFFVGIASIILVGGYLALLIKLNIIGRTGLTDLLLLTLNEEIYPRATSTVQKLWLILFAIITTIIVLFLIPQTRSFFKKIIFSSATTVCSGFAIGFLLGVPTILWSGNYFLASIEMFIERNKLGQVFIHNLFDAIKFFLFGINVWDSKTPEIQSGEIGIIYTYLQGFLLVAGILIILIKRKNLLFPILATATIGILSQYGKLQTTRHLVAWLPYFLIIMAVPVAKLYDWCWLWLEKRGYHNNKQFFQAFSLLTLTIIFIMTFKVQVSSINLVAKHFQEKLVLFPQMEQWIAENIAEKDMIFHTCCEPINQDVILDWMKLNGVKIPSGIKRSKRSKIWFGDKEALIQAQKGYIIISANTFPGQYINYYKKMRPSSMVDPFNDKHFLLRKIIDPGTLSTYQIYYFDFQKESLKS
ncbi:glycosyltransferase family 39 protein [Pantanalinema rosaneae CENA516]|uniref:glycosyltransferase family 39 protein n=1 Tax=Pantanalinema rosaneae TaxID=1620701 RepID=UPI003D6E9BCA